jgi:predicted nucleic acid-binding protein
MAAPARLFVDSAAFIALADEADQYHARAKEFAGSLGSGTRLYTAEPVLVETFSNLQYGLGSAAARRFADSIFSGESGAELLFPALEDVLAASRIGHKYQDQDFSLVDCLSFALMERNKIEHAFTFDRHFAVYRHSGKRFKIVPEA